MSLFYECEKLTDLVNYPILLEVVQGKWTRCDEEVRWEEDGEVYNGELREGSHTQNDAVFINMDNGCGMTLTKVFIKFFELDNNTFEDQFWG